MMKSEWISVKPFTPNLRSPGIELLLPHVFLPSSHKAPLLYTCSLLDVQHVVLPSCNWIKKKTVWMDWKGWGLLMWWVFWGVPLLFICLLDSVWWGGGAALRLFPFKLVFVWQRCFRSLYWTCSCFMLWADLRPYIWAVDASGRLYHCLSL